MITRRAHSNFYIYIFLVITRRAHNNFLFFFFSNDNAQGHIGHLLSVIGSLCLRRNFWDRHGANCNSLERNTKRKVVSTSKKTILEKDYRHSAAALNTFEFFLKQTITWLRGFHMFLIAYFFLPKSNSSVKMTSLLWGGIFLDVVILFT